LNLPPPELAQATDQAKVEKACGGSQLCILAVLPNILDCQSKCRSAKQNG
jgi:protein disulfide-isomerase A6